MTIQVEVWSDVVCPWCYIGKRRLERAIAALPDPSAVEVTYRSFQLDPTTVREGDESSMERLARKIGVTELQAASMQEQVAAVALGEGLHYDLGAARPTNTFDLHRLLHLALARGVQPAVKEAFLAAYFVQGRDLHDHDTVVEVATAAGLDADDVRTVLADPTAYAQAVDDDRAEAAALGANGVPFFVIDRRYGISGAQPLEQFEQVLTKALAEQPVG